MDGLVHVVRSIFLLCICTVTTYARDYCFDDDDNEYKWCDYGCCGSTWSYDRECCDGTVVAVWIIVLAVIGGILLISTIITIICCFVKKKSHQGQVVGPNTGGATVTHSTVYTTGPTYYPSYTTYPQGPPAYQAQGFAPPPAMPYTNPAYPPPTAPPPAYGQVAGNNTQTSNGRNLPEGLQAPPPVSNPLPGNHRVV